MPFTGKAKNDAGTQAGEPAPVKDKDQSPPSFGDLGKDPKNLFEKTFNYDRCQFKCKSKTEKDLDISSNIWRDNNCGDVKGELEFKKTLSQPDVKINLKGTVDQKFGLTLTHNSLAKGLEVSIGSEIVPVISESVNRLKAKYKKGYGNLGLHWEFPGVNVGRSIIKSDIVIGKPELCFGGSLDYNVSSGCVSRNSVAVAYQWPQTSICLSAVDLKKLSAMFSQKVNDKIELGGEITAERGRNCNKISAVCSYRMDKDIKLKAKMNTHGELALGSKLKINDRLVLKFSSHINLLALNQPTHKFGCGMEVEF